MSDVRYAIEKYRLKKSILQGIDIVEDKNGNAILEAVPSLSTNGAFIMPIDSGVDGAEWGRMKLEASAGPQNVFTIFVVASDTKLDYEQLSYIQCKNFVVDQPEVHRYTGTTDILLYSLKGRYLYIVLEIIYEDELDCSFSKIVIDRVGDVFMGTFPRVYQERNSFFHRYMSVFSSVYTDLDDEIDNLPKLLNLDTCPASLLPIYGKWLGIDTGESFLAEDVLRTLVKESYHLNKMKGTRYCLERICEIMLGETGIIVERNQLTEFLTLEQIREYDKVYGDSQYDVTLLLKKNLPHSKRSQLEFLLEQFLPLRCSLNIVELSQVGGLDTHTYLDVNAAVFNPSDGYLDEEGTMDQNIVLL